MTRKHASAASEPAKDTSCWHEEVETLKQACFQGYPESARYVQISIGSRNSAIHNAYRTSLRPSSLFEPRHPSLKVVSCTWRLPYNRRLHQMTCDMQWQWERTGMFFIRSNPPPASICMENPNVHPHTALTEEFTRVLLEHVRMILPQVHLRKPCYDFSFL